MDLDKELKGYTQLTPTLYARLGNPNHTRPLIYVKSVSDGEVKNLLILSEREMRELLAWWCRALNDRD